MAEEQSVEASLPVSTGDTEQIEAGAATALESNNSASRFPPMTAERVIDIWLGAVAVGAEATVKRAKELTEQAKTLRDDAPEILDAWEQRGRPLREQFEAKIKESFAPIPDNEPSSPSPVAEVPESPTAAVAVPPTVTGRSVKREISALEQRVRELEAQVSVPVDTEANLESTPFGSSVTPAESATLDPLHDELSGMGLADSPYAVSETDVESEHEASEFGETPFRSKEEA